ncbi:MAG: hypothetical protein ACI97A_002846 [Planctomycetota bacterium]|jgi:hypothetical protein
MLRLLILSCFVVLCPSLVAQEDDLAVILNKKIKPLFNRYCFSCHSEPEADGDLDLESISSSLLMADRRKTLRSIRSKIRSGEMPPPQEKRKPSPQEKLSMISWAAAALARPPSIPDDPGRVVMRRLSRYEYDRTIGDLFGVTTELSAAFPADELLHGFDNLGGAATMSVLHLEKYADAAEDIATKIIDIEDPSNPTERHFEAEEMECTLSGATDGSDASLYSNATITQLLSLPRAGVYELHMRVWGDQAGPDPARMRVEWDSVEIETIDVSEKRSEPVIKKVKINATGGNHKVALSFINDYYRPKLEDQNKRDRNLHIDYLKVVGPTDQRKPTYGQSWILAKDPGRGKPGHRAKPIIAELCRRVWRRPASNSEVRRLSKLVALTVSEGSSFFEAIQFAIQAVLVSPHFIFRIEPGGHRGKAHSVKELKDFELATRLSYFVWSSTPDEALLKLASKKKLRDPLVLQSELTRMLEDPRSGSLAESFAAQWLELRNLVDATPDVKKYPDYTPELSQAMATESQMLFMEVLRRNLPVYRLLDADFTFVNEVLAKHYGMKDVKGNEFQRVILAAERRGGILTHASVLTVTSNPTRTSPVKRGKWLLENIFGTPPSPPPPGVDSFTEGDISSSATLREQMAAHSKNAVCASCHVRMDALGLTLENFDPIGRWRSQDSGGTIDASSVLPDGKKISGAKDLRAVASADESFLRTVTMRMFVYAIGRELDDPDEIAVDVMLSKLDWRQATLKDLISGIVTLDAFRKRRVGR